MRPTEKLVFNLLALAAGGCATGTQAQSQTSTEASDPLSKVIAQGQSLSRTHLMLSGSVYGGLAYDMGGPKNYGTIGGPSSLMFRGREDIGGGNAIAFKLEEDINVLTGAAGSGPTLFSKQSYLAVQGKWGTVRMGRLYTPSFATLALVVDPTATYSVITATNLMETHGVRANNGIYYNSPGFDPYTYSRNGFVFAAAHFFGAGDQAGGYKRNSIDAINVGYGGGKLTIEMSYQRQNTYASDSSDVNFKSFLIGGSYQLDLAKIHFGFSTQSARNAGAGDVKTKDSKDFLIGLTLPFGPGTLMASFIHKNDKFNNNRAYMIGAVYDYPLSKRTKITLGAIKMGNSNHARYQYTVSTPYAGLMDAGTRTSAVTLGITHNF